jgi:hypothetical protein
MTGNSENHFRNHAVNVFSLFWMISMTALFVCPALATISVPMAWNPSVDSNIAGYKIYYGLASHVYTSSVDVGNSTNATITLLSGNITNYFAATTYDIGGVESGFSNEIEVTVPPTTAATLTPAPSVNGQFAVSVSGVTNYQYVVQASTNLVDWVVVQTNTAPFTFVDSNAGQFSQRFYRTMNLH